MPKFRRLIPRPQVTADDVSLFAASQGWIDHGTREGKTTPITARIWTPPDGATRITLVEDRALGLRYMTIAGEAERAVEETVRAGLPFVRRDEVLEMLRTAPAPEDVIGALQILGAFANEYDEELAGALVRTFDHDDAQVRRAAIIAALYTEWRELEEPLERVRTSDRDEEIRDLARIALESLRPIWQRENR
ncbi:MAG TPA: hypothetical protein VF111_13630 [Thermoanaerobaculia bacterium]